MDKNVAIQNLLHCLLEKDKNISDQESDIEVIEALEDEDKQSCENEANEENEDHEDAIQIQDQDTVEEPIENKMKRNLPAIWKKAINDFKLRKSNNPIIDNEKRPKTPIEDNFDNNEDYSKVKSWGIFYYKVDISLEKHALISLYGQ